MVLHFSILVIVIIIIGFYMAWNIGANDLANSMASSVGARAVTLRNAVILGGLLAFIGAVFVGSHVTETIKSGIVDPKAFEDFPGELVYGSIAALLGASFWITIATWKELPISTTHSIVGGMTGFGIAAGGVGIINWFKLGSIAASWVISPILGGVLAYFMFKLVLKCILQDDDPFQAAINFGPIFIAITILIVASSIFFKTPLGYKLGLEMEYRIVLAILITILAGIIGRIILTRFFVRTEFNENHTRQDRYDKVEHIFSRLQLMTACYVAFALGANDVANAIGPVSAAYNAEIFNEVGREVQVPFYLLIIGGAGIIIGMSTWGYKVIRTIGKKITYLTNTRGFSIEFGAATSVLLASKLGMPVSTTHAVVGAVVGVGLARGLEAIDLSIIKKIVVTWVVTVPISAITAGGLFLLFINLFPIS